MAINWGSIIWQQFGAALYTMRHAQEHAAQLSLHLGQKTGTAPGWVSRATEAR